MKRRFYFHGHLKEAVGEFQDLAVRSVAEGVKALVSQIPGLEAKIRQGHYKIHLGAIDDDVTLTADELRFNLCKTDEIHIVPTPMAAGKVGRIIAGIVILVAAIYIAVQTGNGSLVGTLSELASGSTSVFGVTVPISTIATIGAALVLSGITAIQAPVAEEDDSERDTGRLRYDGPQTSFRQGAAIPVVYGQMRVGGVLASAGFSSQPLLNQSLGTDPDTIQWGDCWIFTEENVPIYTCELPPL